MAKRTTLHPHTHSLPDLTRSVKFLPPQGMNDLVQIFQALSDLTRVKVVFALTGGERNVNDIADLVGASPSAVSHHLRRLKDAGLVTFHRHGNQVFYSIEDVHIAAILREASNHIDHARLGSQSREAK
ncbi:MAG TPA: metalloregulator ArsR/SmtB family transcription factor [Anaerolineae bacterium]|nr:metalloregulator ArsR/SmtB family transcription factor [Anaerolineae bacterium]